MEFINELQSWLAAKSENDDVFSEAVENLLLLLSPFAPHLSDELLSGFGFENSAYQMPWPQADEEAAKENQISIPVQINGKLKARVTVAPDADESTLRAVALAEIADQLEGREPRRVIIIPGRMINVVI